MKQCPLCEVSAATDYLNLPNSKLVRCVSCGLVRVEAFSDNSTSYEGEEYFVKKNCYVVKWDEFCRIFDDLLDKVNLYKKGGSFLDVGCGVGCLVSRALERGFSSQGVEISNWAADFAREFKGLNVVTGSLEEAAYQTDSFDVVVINHVLEHVPDPGALLREARRILKKDGLLAVGVPNIDSIMARLAGARWASLRPEEHRWHFAPDTVKSLLKKNGFNIIRFEARESHTVFGWGGTAMLRRIINRIAAVTNKGEAMLVFAAKSDEGSW